MSGSWRCWLPPPPPSEHPGPGRLAPLAVYIPQHAQCHSVDGWLATPAVVYFAVEFLDMHRIEPLDPTVLALCVPLPSLESESHI